jgi:Spy/CpxP family protein refolding chaperone
MTDSIAPRPPEQGGSLKRWLVIALVISAAFNLFALGFIAARALRPHGHGHGPHAEHGPFMGPRGMMREAFGSETRPLVDKVMARHGESLRGERMELRRARRAVRDALLQEPFDAAQLERALAGLRARTDSSQQHMHEALVELARTLPLEQRKRLAKRASAFDGVGGPP